MIHVEMPLFLSKKEDKNFKRWLNILRTDIKIKLLKKIKNL